MTNSPMNRQDWTRRSAPWLEAVDETTIIMVRRRSADHLGADRLVRSPGYQHLAGCQRESSNASGSDHCAARDYKFGPQSWRLQVERRRHVFAQRGRGTEGTINVDGVPKPGDQAPDVRLPHLLRRRIRASQQRGGGGLADQSSLVPSPPIRRDNAWRLCPAGSAICSSHICHSVSTNGARSPLRASVPKIQSGAGFAWPESCVVID